MKKIFTMAAIAAATIFAASCAKEIEEDIQKEGIAFVVRQNLHV